MEEIVCFGYISDLFFKKNQGSGNQSQSLSYSHQYIIIIFKENQKNT